MAYRRCWPPRAETLAERMREAGLSAEVVTHVVARGGLPETDARLRPDRSRDGVVRALRTQAEVKARVEAVSNARCPVSNK